MNSNKTNIWSKIMCFALIGILFCPLPAIAKNQLSADFMGEEDREIARKYDLDYIHFRNILKKTSKTKERNKALFALGEYFYLLANYKDAKDYFHRFLSGDIDDDGKLFAYGYLLRVAQYENDEESKDEYRNKILTLKQQIYVFKDSKEYEFTSPLERHHRAVYSIEEVDIYVESDLLVKIIY